MTNRVKGWTAAWIISGVMWAGIVWLVARGVA